MMLFSNVVEFRRDSGRSLFVSMAFLLGFPRNSPEKIWVGRICDGSVGFYHPLRRDWIESWIVSVINLSDSFQMLLTFGRGDYFPRSKIKVKKKAGIVMPGRSVGTGGVAAMSSGNHDEGIKGLACGRISSMEDPFFRIRRVEKGCWCWRRRMERKSCAEGWVLTRRAFSLFKSVKGFVAKERLLPLEGRFRHGSRDRWLKVREKVKRKDAGKKCSHLRSTVRMIVWDSRREIHVSQFTSSRRRIKFNLHSCQEAHRVPTCLRSQSIIRVTLEIWLKVIVAFNRPVDSRQCSECVCHTFRSSGPNCQTVQLQHSKLVLMSDYVQVPRRRNNFNCNQVPNWKAIKFERSSAENVLWAPM